jgi:hypothetical protein
LCKRLYLSNMSKTTRKIAKIAVELRKWLLMLSWLPTRTTLRPPECQQISSTINVEIFWVVKTTCQYEPSECSSVNLLELVKWISSWNRFCAVSAAVIDGCCCSCSCYEGLVCCPQRTKRLYLFRCLFGQTRRVTYSPQHQTFSMVFFQRADARISVQVACSSAAVKSDPVCSSWCLATTLTGCSSIQSPERIEERAVRGWI